MGDEGDLDELREELDEYPLPADKESDYPKPEDRKSVSYKNVDVTVEFNKESKTAEGDEERILFTDGGFDFGGMIWNDKTEKLRIPIVLAKEMVYHYDSYDAFRPKEELKAVAGFLKGVPVTRGHPEAKMVTDREEVLGWAIEGEFEDDELRAVLEIADKDLINDIRSKKLQGVSPGHFSRLDRTTSGEYDGEHYDLTQRAIFVDHIAIVERGRCNMEDGCGIMMNTKLDVTKTKEGDEGKAMKGIVSKLKEAIDLAAKLEDEQLKTKLEEILKAIEEEEKAASGDGASAGGLSHPDEKSDQNQSVVDGIDETAMKQLKEERDTLKVELDTIVKDEKVKLVDELSTLQDVKTGEELKNMSLDSLKSDLKLVKALRESKFSTDGHGDSGDSQAKIKSAYKSVGTKGGKK